MKVNILGDGLTGLLAAHAATLAGHVPTIYVSHRWMTKRESLVVDKQIPGIRTQPFVIHRGILGSMPTYVEKAGMLIAEMGDYQDGPAWSVGELEAELWDKYSNSITYLGTSDGFGDSLRADLVVSASAAAALCESDDCQFHYEEYWETEFSKPSDVPNNSIIASGLEMDWWHTVARVNGKDRTWYPSERRPNSPLVRKREVPTYTDCECNKHIVRVGFYGAWDGAAKSSDGFFKVREALEEMS